MMTAWIDEKLLGDSLSDFRTQFLGEVKTIEGKSLRPFRWSRNEPRHVFGVNTYLIFLSSIQVLVLDGEEKSSYQGAPNLHLPKIVMGHAMLKPLILFGDTARHAIQSIDFAHIETLNDTSISLSSLIEHYAK